MWIQSYQALQDSRRVAVLACSKQRRGNAGPKRFITTIAPGQVPENRRRKVGLSKVKETLGQDKLADRQQRNEKRSRFQRVPGRSQLVHGIVGVAEQLPEIAGIGMFGDAALARLAASRELARLEREQADAIIMLGGKYLYFQRRFVHGATSIYRVSSSTTRLTSTVRPTSPASGNRTT